MRTVVFCLLTIIASINGGVFRCDYKHFPAAGGWIKYHPIAANWHEARLRCNLEGATLASPLNKNLKAALLSSISTGNPCGVFTGINDLSSRGDFFSIEGVPLWKMPQEWAYNEPNNHDSEERCLLMSLEGELADIDCADSYPYLCFKEDSNTTAINECGTDDNGYTLDHRTGSCYKFHREPRTWSRSYMTCAAEGGHLAIINSDTEAQVIVDIFSKNPERLIPGNFWKKAAFIGFQYVKEQGKWLTVHGQTLEEAGYARWNPGEPNNKTNTNSSGQECGAVFRNGLFDDGFCSGGAYDSLNFICEMRPNSLMCDDIKQ